MNSLKRRIREVVKQYEDLPKSKNDNGLFVIIAEMNQSEGYEENKECLGVTKEGELIWCYLSGCSCTGDNENKKITDITAKVFVIRENETATSFYEKNKIDPIEEIYCSY